MTAATILTNNSNDVTNAKTWPASRQDRLCYVCRSTGFLRPLVTAIRPDRLVRRD